MDDFFNRFDTFLANSRTSANAERLNARFAAILGHNLSAFAGKRVLDIASHDGRWSFAALQASSSHVTGIELRPGLVRNARATFVRYGVAPYRYEFLQADAFDALKRPIVPVDTVLCLCFLYHTVRHVELIDLISRTQTPRQTRRNWYRKCAPRLHSRTKGSLADSNRPSRVQR